MEINNTQDLFNAFPWKPSEIDDSKLLHSALSTRGKWKGNILASKPQGFRGVVWLALISHVSPVRIGIASVMMMNEAERTIYNRLDKLLESTGLGKCLSFSEPAMRWNLKALNTDRDTFNHTIARNCQILRDSGRHQPGDRNG